MKKRAVAVLYSPKTLLDFIWYYVTYGQDYEWDVIVVPYGDDVEQIQPYLEKTDIFRRIIVDDKTEKFQSMGDKIKQFGSMIGCYLFGKQKVFCKKYVNQRVKIDEYSLVLIPTTHMMLTGILIALSDEYTTVILEDGILDYTYKKEKFDKRDLFKFWNLVGYFLSKMGYANTHQSNYRLEKTKYCDKYSTKPELMKYLNYRSISRLNDMDICDIQLYKRIVNRTFELPSYIDFVDFVLFTAPLDDYEGNSLLYVEETVRYINENCHDKVVFLKKHPRDLAIYNFDSSVKVIEIEKEIPAELLLTYFDVEKYVFMWPSSFLQSAEIEKEKIELLYFEYIAKEVYKKNFYISVEATGLKTDNVVVLSNEV